MSSKVKTGVKIIRKKEHGGERIYIYLPEGVKFFGGIRHIFCRFPGVDFFYKDHLLGSGYFHQGLYDDI